MLLIILLVVRNLRSFRFKDEACKRTTGASFCFGFSHEWQRLQVCVFRYSDSDPGVKQRKHTRRELHSVAVCRVVRISIQFRKRFKATSNKKKVINSGIFISGFSFNLIGTMANKSHICGKLCIVFAFRQLLPYLAGSAIISSFAFVCVRSEFDGTKNPSVLHIFELCRGTANYQINLQSRKKRVLRTCDK